MVEVRKFGKKEFDYYVSKLSRGNERDRKRAEELLNQYDRWRSEGYSLDDAAKKALASVQLKTAIEMKKKTGESYWDKVRGRILTQHQKHARYMVRGLRTSEEEREIDRLNRLAMAVQGGIRPPTSEESEKQMKEWERKRESKSEQMELKGVKCPHCGSKDIMYDGRIGRYICKNCGYSSVNADDFYTSKSQSAFSEFTHSSFLTMALYAIIGILFPIIFGNTFDYLGTVLVGVGIILLGFAKGI